MNIEIRLEGAREALLRERIGKLEATANAYDAALHTGGVDTMRRRIAELERGLFELWAGNALDEQTRGKVALLLQNKSLTKY